MDLTSDPHAWLRPYYVALKNDRAFWMLAAQQRFEALCCAVEPEHPSQAAAMCEWSPAAQQGILGWVETVTNQKPAVRELELWRVTKDTREFRCVVRYLPTGVDLRLMLGDARCRQRDQGVMRPTSAGGASSTRQLPRRTAPARHRTRR
jgi:hypothetical protein